MPQLTHLVHLMRLLAQLPPHVSLGAVFLVYLRCWYFVKVVLPITR